MIDSDLEYFREVLLGVRRYGFESGQLQFADRWLPHELDDLKRAVQRDKIDGIVASIDDAKLERRLLATGCQVINISNSLRVPKAPVVSQDDIEVGRLAARHLKDCGCRSFGFIGQGKASYSDQRGIGFREVLSKSAPLQNIDLKSAELSVESYRQVSQWMAPLPSPTGIFAVLDAFALTAQRAARELGLRVPEDIAILGAGNDDFQVEFEQIPLSSIRLPAREIGYQAGALLDRLLRDPATPRESIQLPVQDIALRRSTDVQYCEDPLVAKAVKRIREQPGIRVAQVVEAAGISRTGLQRRFHQTLGRGILSEIQRVRLQRAQTLLATTDDKQEVIAELSGFASVQRFSHCFQQAFDMSPGTYRKRMQSNRPHSAS